jgi:hypothetical protein
MMRTPTKNTRQRPLSYTICYWTFPRLVETYFSSSAQFCCISRARLSDESAHE